MRGAAVLILALAGCAARPPAPPHAAARPLRVMSTNQCADQIVLMLLPPGRIASVTWLSRDPGTSPMAAAAARVGVNHGQAEEVLRQRPDLVIAGSYTTPALKGMLARVGTPVLEVDDAPDAPAIRRVTREIAAAVGARARGEALIAAMDEGLAELARDAGPPVEVAAWDRSGFAAGPGTLFATLLAAAGARDVAAGADGFGGRRPDVEELLRARPAVLVRSAPGGATRGDDLTDHRAVRRLWRGRTVTVLQSDTVCGTPLLAAAARRLRAQLRAASRAG